MGGGSWHTATIDNTLSPTWNQILEPFRVSDSTRIRWELMDADLESHDSIIGIWDDTDAHTISVDRIRAGRWTEGGEGIVVTFEIVPI